MRERYIHHSATIVTQPTQHRQTDKTDRRVERAELWAALADGPPVKGKPHYTALTPIIKASLQQGVAGGGKRKISRIFFEIHSMGGENKNKKKRQP